MSDTKPIAGLAPVTLNPIALDLSTLVRELRTELTDPTVPAAFSEPDDGGPAFTVLRDGWKLQERKPPTRPAMRHEFEDLDSVAAWVKARAPHPEDVDVLIAQHDEGAPAAVVDALLAPYSPTGDRVTCVVANHPTLLRWRSALKAGWMTQRQLHTFLRTVKDTFSPITASNGDALGSQADQLIAALTRIEFSRSENFNTELAPNGMVKVVSADASNALNVALPEEVTVRMPWFLGVTGEAGEIANAEPTKFYELRIALSVDIQQVGGAKVPKFSLTCLNWDEEYAFALADAVAHLQRRLGSAFRVLRGTAKTHEVATRTLRATSGPGVCTASFPRVREGFNAAVGSSVEIHVHDAESFDEALGQVLKTFRHLKPADAAAEAPTNAGPAPTESPTHDAGDCGPAPTT